MTRPNLRLLPAADPSLSEQTDDRLMQLAQAGLQPAFEALVERHATRVVAVCSRYERDHSVALELAQETWVSVWEQRARYTAQGQFVVWLITAARNRCRNHVRHRAIVRRHQQQVAPPPSSAEAPVEVLLAAERCRRTQRALARLPEQLREPLCLRFEDELRYEQMAEVLGVAEGTLRARVHRALKLLRHWLEVSS